MATSMPPDWLKAAGKLRRPAPRPALTTRNTEAYQDDPTPADKNKRSTVNTELGCSNSPLSCCEYRLVT